MQDAPGSDERGDDDSEGEVIVPFWLVGKQDESRHEHEYNGNCEEGILVGNQIQVGLGSVVFRVSQNNCISTKIAGKCHILSVTVFTLTIQLSSFTIVQRFTSYIL